MTESERIINEGILPESFFNEETRCDFLVTKKRKKIWAIEIDLFLKFAEVCEKYGFRYFAIFGTLLGAVRHKGMIPWDDDIDVCMPRKDYDEFCKVCVTDFTPPYLLQTPFTDSGYYYSFAKIRNINSTCMPHVMSKAGFCHGIFLDIFPLDNCNPDTYENDRKEIFQRIMKCSSAMKEKNTDLDEAQQEKLHLYHTDNPIEEFERIQRIAGNPSYKDSPFIGIPVNTILKSSQLVWNTEDFSDYTIMPFEGFDIRVPIGYLNVLHTIYGDYMKFPPIDKRGDWHSGVIWDTDKSYLNFL